MLANRLSQTMLHIGLGLFHRYKGVDRVTHFPETWPLVSLSPTVEPFIGIGYAAFYLGAYPCWLAASSGWTTWRRNSAVELSPSPAMSQMSPRCRPV
jgi:hypothetical protein